MNRRAIVLVVGMSVAAFSICGCASNLSDEARELEKARVEREQCERSLDELKRQVVEAESKYNLKLTETSNQRDLAEKQDQRDLSELKEQRDLAQKDYDTALAELKKHLEEAQKAYDKALAASKAPPAPAGQPAPVPPAPAAPPAPSRPNLAELKIKVEDAQKAYEAALAGLKQQTELRKHLTKLKQQFEDAETNYHIALAALKQQDEFDKQQRELEKQQRELVKQLGDRNRELKDAKVNFNSALVSEDKAAVAELEKKILDAKTKYDQSKVIAGEAQCDLAKVMALCGCDQKNYEAGLAELKRRRDESQKKFKDAQQECERELAKLMSPADLKNKLEDSEESYQRKVADVAYRRAKVQAEDQGALDNLKRQRVLAEKSYEENLAWNKIRIEQANEKEKCALAKICDGIGDDLDGVAESVNKWGKVGISEMALLQNNGQFSLGYSANAADYVAAARQGVSASASSAVIQSLQLALGLTGTLQPPIVSAGSNSNQSTSSTTSAGSSIGGNGVQSQSAGTSNQIASAPASSSGSTGGAGQPQTAGTSSQTTSASTSLSLSGSAGSGGSQTQAGGNNTPASSAPNLAVSERTAMTTGLNDKLAELVLSQLSNPPVSGNSLIFFGVFQVTCQPGSENWKDYIAEVDVAVEYARTDPLSGKLDLSRHWGNNVPYVVPSVLAVLPLMNSQTMDLSASRSDQTELALTLAAMAAAHPGTTAQANMLMDYVKQQNAQLNSRTAVPTVTTYADGSNFGFQIYPAYQAIENPAAAAAARAGGANVLQPICFPAVVVLRVDKSDFDPQNPWDTLVTHVHTRWIPTRTSWSAEHPTWTAIFTFGGYNPFYTHANRPPSFTDRITFNNRLDDASKRMDILLACNAVTASCRDAENTLPPLITAVRGITHTCPLPISPDFLKKSGSQQSDQDTLKTAKLTIQGGPSSDSESATPEAGQNAAALVGFVNAPTVISVASDKMPFQLMNQPTVKMVTLDGCLCSFNVVGKNTLTVTVPAGSFDDRPLLDPKNPTKVIKHLLTLTITGASQASSSTTTATTASQDNSLATNVNIQFVKTINEPVSYPTEFGYKPTITITRDSLGKVTGIIVDPSAKMDTETLVRILSEILLKSEATHAPELPVIIKSETLPAAGGGGK
ncbi:MAG: hypothetical protein ACLQVA_00905 [Candidatus Brocadiia bacterium]